MNVKTLAAKLKEVGSQSENEVTFEPVTDCDAFLGAPQPLFGEVAWQLPESYKGWLAEIGCFSLGWNSFLMERMVEINLLSPEAISETSEIVYVPEGVDMGAGDISTNHLVPFASAEDEAAFCFDVRGSGEYPVYYHHQDEPRACLSSSGAWDGETPESPDFANFEAWLAG